MNKNLKKHIASLIGLLVLGILAVGSLDTDTDTQKIQSQSASYTLTANQLYGEYDSNEVAADAKYKGKIVIVSGTIQNIGKDIADNAYIVIGGKGFLDGVQCTFTKGEESSVARLSKGQNVTVKGEVSGKMGNVLVNKARVQ
jgi:hypothetical protein